VRKYITAIVCTIAVLFIAAELFFAARGELLFGDFRAFYCSGSALLHGTDPYAGSTLYACERTSMPFGLYAAVGDIAVPAPFPGYALAFFAIFAALPYVVACVVWLIVLLATTAGSCVALARLTGKGLAAAVSAIVVSLAVMVLPYGELTSIELCALLWLALAVRAKRLELATIAAAFAMILPHVGIPALLGLFVWEAGMRWRLVLLAAFLSAIDILPGGVHTAIAYIANVLPAHTLSEIGGVNQYGLTWVLHALGARDAIAIHAGEASFVVMLIAGVLAAGALSRQSGDRAYLPLIPPAFAVFGGSFMHYTEIIVALGAATLLAVRATPRLRTMFSCALLLLAMPWLSIMGQPFLIFVFAIACAAIALWICDYDARTTLRLAFAGVFIAAAIDVVAFSYGPALPHVPGSASVNPALAQASWAQFVGASRSSSGIAWWIGKAPTWIGLALLTFGCLYAVAKEDFVAPVAIEQAPVVS
jgi:hypothetical protein